MPELIKVGMADYKVGRAPDTLISYGLGSCIGISLYDPQTKIGGLLHIMLPDSNQSRANENRAKFADTGIPDMLEELIREVQAGGKAGRGGPDVCFCQRIGYYACRPAQCISFQGDIEEAVNSYCG